MKIKHSEIKSEKNLKKQTNLPDSKKPSTSGFNLEKPDHAAIILKSFWIFVSCFLLLISLNTNGQSKLTANGYVKFLSMYYHPGTELPGIDASHLASNLFHNRLNFRWFPSNEFTASLEIRNRLFLGQIVKKFPDYKSFIDSDNGYLNMS